MDEPGAHRSTGVWTQDKPPDKIFRLLFPWNGRLRNDQREPSFSGRHGHYCFPEGSERGTSSPRGGVLEKFVEEVETMLGVSVR